MLEMTSRRQCALARFPRERAEAVLKMRGYGQDYIKSEDIVFPRGEVPIKNEYKPMVISTDVYTHVA